MDRPIPWEKIQFYLKNFPAQFDSDFVNWLESNPDNQNLWNELIDIYAVTGEIPNSFNPNTTNAWDAIERRAFKPSKTIQFHKYFLRIAASVLMVLLGASAMWMTQFYNIDRVNYTEVYSPYGHKTMIVLPDSSTVWLNGDSKIRYKSDFKNSRNVELTGEALFSVTKDKNHLFRVKSENLHVEVYGTKFNFKDYKNDDNAEVALLTGSLGVFKGKNLLHKLEPGEVITYMPEIAKYKVFYQDIKQITSWSEDELVINNQSFEDVVKYLERWYGVKINFVNNGMMTEKLSFKLKTESLSELLSIINRITPIQYSINGKEVTINKNS